ncbi:MAG: amino acid adenylation domain-containing protein, partial [Chitinophagaceae bacterium]|nr:amino acid adenylation domain-containing protein [Anaerolineae bacterium]
MSIIDLFNKLKALGVKLWLEGDQLRYQAPKGTVSKELLDEIASRKSGVIDFIRQINYQNISGAQTIIPVDVWDRPIPASYSQQSLWVFDKINPGSRVYNLNNAVRIKGDLQVPALGLALKDMIVRHESLRTVFDSRDGQPVQVVLKDLEHDIDLITVVPSGAKIDEDVRKEISGLIERPFNLEKGPLWRLSVFKISPTDHVLVFVIHHVVSDAWSNGIFITELLRIYESYAYSEKLDLAPLPIRFIDYAHWQKDFISNPEVRKYLADYWKHKLDGHGPLDLPTDFKRPALQDFSGDTVSMVIPNIDGKIHEAALREDVTLFMFLLAAFEVLLYRYSGQEDFLVGTIVANRNRSELGSMMGFLVNTLAIRSDVSPDLTFREALKKVRQTLLDAYAHQELPFDLLLEELRPERDPSRTPLFQVMYIHQNAVDFDFRARGIDVEIFEIANKVAPFDLRLSTFEVKEGILCKLDFSTGLFEQSTINRMLESYKNIILGMLDGADRQIYSSPFLSEFESDLMLNHFNQTHREYPTDKLIHQVFEDVALNNPDHIALVFEGETLSYGELNRRANKLARFLRDQGVGPDIPVGICLERSFEMVICILGILKAGGAYVPFDPTYPKERVDFMINNSNVKILLTVEKCLQIIPSTGAIIVCLDRDDCEAFSGLDTNLENVVTKDNSAYIIYTSGSTGLPKGAVNTHIGLLNHKQWMQEAFPIGINDKVLQKTPFSFDVSIWEFLWPLMIGAQLVIARPEGHKDPNYIIDTIYTEGITIIHFVPSMLSVFLECPELKTRCKSLTRVFCSGEALSVELLKKFKTHFDIPLHNVYGPAECSDVSTAWTWDGADADRGVLIGKPISNVKVYIVDGHLNPVPIGVVGEICVAGIGVGKGYINNEDLTREKFLPNPFVPGERMYRTGDLARWLPDGNIDYQGRVDFQVKIRGFRIELGEIENQLAKVEGVKEAVVIDRASESGDKYLCAYVVMKESFEFDIGQLRGSLGLTLPDYMVPSHFVVMEGIPLSPNGKVDRRALPEPDVSLTQAEYVAPRTETERLVAQIWQEVLGLERIGVHDNFFQLGGHSLLGIQLIARLQQCGLRVGVAELFSAPSLGALADAIDNQEGTEKGSSGYTVPANLIPDDCGEIRPEMLALVSLDELQLKRIVAKVPGGDVNVQDIYPLSPIQEGVLFHHMLSNKQDPYVMMGLSRVDGKEKLDSFLTALQQVVARHDVLRTMFIWKDISVPVQVVQRHADLQVHWQEVRAGSSIERQAIDLYEEEPKWMDLEQAPLIGLKCLRDSATDQHYLIIKFHHLVTDHISVDLVFAELMTILNGGQVQLPTPVPYREYVAVTRQHDTRVAEEYFREALAGIDAPTLPFGLTEAHGDGSAVDVATNEFSEEMSLRIRRVSREMRVSPATLFHTAWAMVLSACSGRDDVVFGTVLSGRLHADLQAELMVGMLINTLPFRVSLSGKSARSVVEQVHHGLLSMIPHERLSGTVARRASGFQGDVPLFTALLNYRHGGDRHFDVKGIEIIREDERTNYAIGMSIVEGGEKYGVEVQVHLAIQARRVIGLLETAMAGLLSSLELSPE